MDNNGTILYSDIARTFFVLATSSAIFRNHFEALPMAGVVKRDFPRINDEGFGFQWGRETTNSASDGTDTDPTLDEYAIEVDSLEGFHEVRDGFVLFNPAGAAFVQQNLIPGMRRGMQRAEDKAGFLSVGSAPYSTKWRGLKGAVGATVIASSTNGDAFTLDMMGVFLRAMPARLREDPSRLAYYLPPARCDDFVDLIAARATTGGDAYVGMRPGQENLVAPGMVPIGFYRNIPVYSTWCLPTSETQGTSTDAATGYLVHRDMVKIGDGAAVRIEPYRKPGFKTRLQIQTFVGVGYPDPAGIVRRAGIRPKA
ncbi:MAG: hypothetical protein HC933_23040 [Pleurocapsa sp. SU_196_0]|nr:hypothetical protein [Pleurocapsa sp. SU_196_0]